MRSSGAVLAPSTAFAHVERILYPSDPSAPSDAAYAHARLLADRFAAALIVHHPSGVPSGAVDASTGLALHSVPAPASVEAEAAESETELALLRAVQMHLPDLVVMSTHARAGLAQACLGSAVECVLRRGIRPVLCVPPNALPAGPYRRILVPIDGSEVSLRALPWAGELAEAFGSTIVVLHALSPETPSSGGALRAAPFDETRLGALVRPRLPGLPVEVAVVIASPAWSTITHAAREQDADLVVMASQGRHGLRDAPVGSTAERVVRHSALPVLVA
ncbi:MAG TPA: universal stress protein [Vicinamibacteria bacterium]|nr:universal stress protein [Vicinamibacteria bacterium]